jgi:tRNA-Thr(GGU) m(6)t(6)A37 methyltransferase TsaA
MKKIIMSPIGFINSPYKDKKDIPIQGRFKDEVVAWIELKPKYVKGLKDLEKFSHAIVLYFFHKSNIEHIEGKPFLEDVSHGIFAIRSPNRPNHIGVSVVKIKNIKNNKLYFTKVDMIDKTPVLDIKPYIKYFDSQDSVVSGWLDKHFKNGEIPDNVFSK